MDKDLFKQLILWHEDGEYEKIIDRISEIPKSDRDYDLVSHLARALNNEDHYKEAIQQLLSIQEQGKDDSLWHFRMGYAYYYLGQHEEAVKAFERTIDLNPIDEVALVLLKSCLHFNNRDVHVEESSFPSDLQEFKACKEEKILDSMRSYITPEDDDDEEDFNQPYMDEDVDCCGFILDNFIDRLSVCGGEDEIMACVKSVVGQLNTINGRCGYELIETGERENLCEFIIRAANLAGYPTNEDVTEEWRDW
ncbi:tetratricopeptide repeat protein [Sporosarcina limicola]|uniref:Tetratricopeptide (TPR) repeat protein n=1 Tax=Sporosarcina limicola TaxID=34101 RepID=A0A927MQK5_9BACL|nr:tetratricopeptide repeat protein [Sporosarcina limicola]MBE1555551.1 tetratricopeptide (TPR) repeat protein [Sporosarcina limicola]